ncbi:MAG: calcium-binding protein [Gordonia sp.]|nr:calcium-binding protein [Gordonia sp. (in: high G+C Gram-positive bacteria)]
MVWVGSSVRALDVPAPVPRSSISWVRQSLDHETEVHDVSNRWILAAAATAIMAAALTGCSDSTDDVTETSTSVTTRVVTQVVTQSATPTTTTTTTGARPAPLVPATTTTPAYTPPPEPVYTPPPAPVVPDAPSVSYKNCAAVRAAGAAPIHSGDAGYSTDLDRDGDGIACET